MLPLARLVLPLARLWWNFILEFRITRLLLFVANRRITLLVWRANLFGRAFLLRRSQDVIRQRFRKCKADEPEATRGSGFPNLFITIAPAEWKFLLQQGLFDGFFYVLLLGVFCKNLKSPKVGIKSHAQYYDAELCKLID